MLGDIGSLDGVECIGEQAGAYYFDHIVQRRLAVEGGYGWCREEQNDVYEQRCYHCGIKDGREICLVGILLLYECGVEPTVNDDIGDIYEYHYQCYLTVFRWTQESCQAYRYDERDALHTKPLGQFPDEGV